MKTARDLAHDLSQGRERQLSQFSWQACCPAHDDHDPSLSITESDGKLLFHCHVGCTQDQVIAALRARGLWSTDKVWETQPYVPEYAMGRTLPKTHPKFGEVKRNRLWEYRRRNGKLVGYVARFDLPDGKKEIVPIAWCKEYDSGEMGWRWKSFLKPRPLYGEQYLDHHKTKPILVVEGEKTADAATKILPDYLVMSWPGGAGAVKHAKWEELKGRDVVLWPDADKAGYQAMALIAEILLKVPAKTVRLVDLPKDLPEGWDLADPLPEGIVPHLLAKSASFYTPSGDLNIDDFNKRYALILLGDKAAVMEEYWEAIDNRTVTRVVSLAGLKSLYANHFVSVGRKNMPLFDYWMQHPNRKTYNHVVFEPGLETPSNYFNYWRGFSVDPDPTGEWGLFNEHLRENVAQGDEDLYTWVMAWFAQIFQQPRVKPGVSLALRGPEGAGKTVVGKHVGSLIRDHYVLVDKPHQVIGNFNVHMAQALLLEADESFFAGDPSNVGRLKSLVTSETNRIEPKGKDSFEVKNYLRLFITSNEEWVVPVSLDNRRFAVLDVGTGRQQDREFFAAMERQLKNGGYEGLLYYLLHFDLTSVDINKIPYTRALAEQKERNLAPVPRFWFNKLMAGELKLDEGRWTGQITKRELFNDFQQASRNWTGANRIDENFFGRELYKTLPEGWPKQKRYPWTKVFENDRLIEARPWGYYFPSLEECRDYFAEKLYPHLKFDWPEDEETAQKELGEEVPF